MIKESIVLSKIYSEIKDYNLVRLFYNIKGTNKIYVVNTIDNVDAQMNTRVFIGNLEDKYKTKLDCKYVKNKDVPKLLKDLEEHDEGIITFGNYITLEEIYIDKDIRIPILQLNDAGFKTRFSCSGHRNLKKFYIMFEFDSISGYIVPLTRGGLFRLEVDRDLLGDNLRLILRLNCTQELTIAGITCKQIMDAIIDLLLYKKEDTLNDLCDICVKIRKDAISKAKVEKEIKIEQFLSEKTLIGE